jgi:hypothetical protein
MIELDSGHRHPVGSPGERCDSYGTMALSTAQSSDIKGGSLPIQPHGWITLTC